jgi:uncharacterized membrane protein
MPNTIILALVIFLHDLFTAVWIGGLITLGIAVLPAARKALGMGPQTRNLMQAIQKRLSTLVYVSIVGLVLTGLLMANRAPAFQGMFSFANAYSTALSLKHILVLIMIIVSLYRSLVLGRINNSSQPSREKLNGALLFLNIGLGLAVLFVSGYCAALSAGPKPV